MKLWGIVLLMVSSCASAQVRQDSACDALGVAAESQLKEIAFNSADGSSDDSAARESNRLLRTSVAASLLQSNLLLMQANKCSMPKAPMTEDAYVANAMECVSGALSESAKRNPAIPECDRSRWSRGKKKQ